MKIGVCQQIRSLFQRVNPLTEPKVEGPILTTAIVASACFGGPISAFVTFATYWLGKKCVLNPLEASVEKRAEKAADVQKLSVPQHEETQKIDPTVVQCVSKLLLHPPVEKRTEKAADVQKLSVLQHKEAQKIDPTVDQGLDIAKFISNNTGRWQAQLEKDPCQLIEESFCDKTLFVFQEEGVRHIMVYDKARDNRPQSTVRRKLQEVLEWDSQTIWHHCESEGSVFWSSAISPGIEKQNLLAKSDPRFPKAIGMYIKKDGNGGFFCRGALTTYSDWSEDHAFQKQKIDVRLQIEDALKIFTKHEFHNSAGIEKENLLINKDEKGQFHIRINNFDQAVDFSEGVKISQGFSLLCRLSNQEVIATWNELLKAPKDIL